MYVVTNKTVKILGAVLCLLINGYSTFSQVVPYAGDIKKFQIDDSLHPKEKGQIVFVGSSSFTNWKDVNTRFPDFKIINRGFGGSTLLDLKNYLRETIITYSPRQVFIYCGENDFAGDTNLLSTVVFERFVDIAVNIRKELPHTEIVFISAKPSPSRWHLREKIKEFNRLVNDYISAQKGFAFVNVWDAMLNSEGVPKSEIFQGDKLHMNKAGYDIWVTILKNYLK